MIPFRRFAFAALVALAALGPATAEERITRFVSDVHVARNGDLDVTETINVLAEGISIRRGILRDFPTSYANKDGTRVNVGFNVESVMRDGAPETFITEWLANGVRVRIGNADRIIGNGPHQFVIKYRTTRQVGFFAEFDELYWNATGTGWTFPIDSAEARITLPVDVLFRQNALYTGPQGATGKDAAVIEHRPGTIVFRTTKPLPAHSGLTVAAAWPKGIVLPPSEVETALNWLRDNLPLGIAGVGLMLVLAYYVMAWRRVGRDPRRGTIIPLFGPPNGMSPAAVRYVSKMFADDKTLSAALVDLGVNGHLRLAESKTGMQIQPRPHGKTVDAAEQALVQGLIGRRLSALDLTPENAKIFSDARIAMKEQLAKAYDDRLFHSNIAWSVRGLLASLALLALVLGSVFLVWGKDQAQATLLGQLSLVPAIVVVSALLLAGWPRRIGGYALLAFGAVFAFLIGNGGYHMIIDHARGWVEVLPAALPLVLAPVASSAFSWMRAYTPEGRQVMDQIEGFRQYLGVAEEDRLNALNPPEKTPELFEKFLPYAIALDVENAWAKRFETILAGMAAGAVANGWYSGSRERTGDVGHFANSLGDRLAQTIASASTPPGSSGSSSSDSSSSGSSGGGSSGGGGGGGGGSGW